MLAYALQHCVIFAFRKVLDSSPLLLDVFRAEGVWDFIFSESFFYFGPAPSEFSGENSSSDEVHVVSNEIYCGSSSRSSVDQVNTNEFEVFQVEVISFMEFVATSNASSHNLVGPSFSFHVSCVDVFSLLLNFLQYLLKIT